MKVIRGVVHSILVDTDLGRTESSLQEVHLHLSNEEYERIEWNKTPAGLMNYSLTEIHLDYKYLVVCI